VTGNLYRPLLHSATILLSSGEKQILDTVSLDFLWTDGEILGTAHETVIGRNEYDEQGRVASMSIEAGTLPDLGG
jgi:hypothetical protein